MTNLVQTSLTLAPALITVGGVAVGGVAVLSSALTAAAGAGTAALFALQGVGEGLERHEHVQAGPHGANLENLREKMAELGPAGREFVATLHELSPELERLQRVAGENMFGGLSDGLEDLTSQMSVFSCIIAEFSEGVGSWPLRRGMR